MSRNSKKSLKSRALSQENLESLSNAVAKLNTLKLFILQSVWHTLTELASKTERLKKAHGLDVLFIDYLQLINSQTNRSTTIEEYEDIVKALKAMARRLDIAVVLLAHSNYEAPLLEKIGHYADNVLVLSRPELRQRIPKPEDRGIAEIKLIKNLPTAETIRLAFIKEICALKNLSGSHLNQKDEDENNLDLDLDF